jgi:hypothetical protein
MQNHTVHLGSATLFSSRAGPRAPAHHSCLPDLAATRARPRRRQRVALRTATRRPRAPPPGHGRGTARRSGPGPMTPSRIAWHSRRRTPPLPLVFPLCRSADRPFSNRARDARPRSVTDPAPAPLSSAASLPTVSVPVPPPLANGGLSLASDFAERRRRLPPLR